MQAAIQSRSAPGDISQSDGSFDAVALFSNQSEHSNELDFKKGEVLRVIEKDVDGLIGWWLCIHGNKTGIAPGNRLCPLQTRDQVGGWRYVQMNEWVDG